MSILLGPFDKSVSSSKDERDSKDLFVFGYHCKLYRDDEKAELVNNGALLIPWMGDTSLMVDRYDIRNRLEDKSLFGLKSNIPHRLTDQEEDLERLLDEERYLALGTDITEEELLREEEQKRMNEELAPEGTYHAVGFTYGQREPESSEEYQLVDQPQMLEHPPSSYVDIVDEGGEYERPFRLFIPPNIRTPFSQKLHAIIERTAKFINKQGQQMEIIIKTKQRFNPNFSFLHHEDALFPYYKHLLNEIKSGAYVPQNNSDVNEIEKVPSENITAQMEEVKVEVKKKVEKEAQMEIKEQSNEESDSDEEFELHPILRANLTSLSKPSTNQNSDSGSSSPIHKPKDELSGIKFTARTFKSIAYTVNAAPDVTNDDKNNTKDHLTNGDQTTLSSNAQQTEGTDNNNLAYTGYDVTAAYYQASQMYQIGLIPPPPDIQPVVDKTAEYVAKNGDGFEVTVIQKHLSDHRFGFLHPWNQYYSYYKSKVAEFKQLYKKLEENAPPNMQKLNPVGAISFKLCNKPGKGLTQQAEGDKEDINEPQNKKLKVSPDVADTAVGIGNTVQAFLSTVKSVLN